MLSVPSTGKAIKKNAKIARALAFSTPPTARLQYKVETYIQKHEGTLPNKALVNWEEKWRMEGL